MPLLDNSFRNTLCASSKI